MYPKIDIVMQGPIVPVTHDFVRRYCEFDCVERVIVSCWKNCPKLHPELCNSEKITVIKKEKPLDPGLGNRNLQIVSSLNGILESKNNYVMKVRTDMFLPNLKEMVDFYFRTSIGQIYTLSMYPRFPFHPRDHVFLGDIENMEYLFNIPLDYTTKTEYNQFRDVRSESYIGTWYYRQFNNTKISEILGNQEQFLTDWAPRKQEALDFYHECMISRKGFVPFPRVPIEWPKHYPNGYPFDHLKNHYGELYHDDLLELLRDY